MNVLLIEQTHVVYSLAPSDLCSSAVVCFKDFYIIVVKGPSHPFRVDHDPVPGYNFPNNDVAAGLRNMIDSASSEDELKAKLFELIQNNGTCVVNFSDYKKVKIGGFLGAKTLKVSNNAMNYISFSVRKDTAKALAQFYSDL
ncbi:MAG: hypothetical protein MI810_16100 [Flavobacteriales bacterium]|jgi:hypothetical protein|nr:hypothetical protein [Flavobacteriales bacterium]